jgi:hypothetical protein
MTASSKAGCCCRCYAYAADLNLPMRVPQQATCRCRVSNSGVRLAVRGLLSKSPQKNIEPLTIIGIVILQARLKYRNVAVRSKFQAMPALSLSLVHRSGGSDGTEVHRLPCISE